mmetsp:Transcript_35282/g.51840  ORF Transcript_35282/g.51840 Transcript_35282/m.51840 type:complete len:144 (+) Transcript_35282:59-490(+)
MIYGNPLRRLTVGIIIGVLALSVFAESRGLGEASLDTTHGDSLTIFDDEDSMIISEKINLRTNIRTNPPTGSNYEYNEDNTESDANAEKWWFPILVSVNAFFMIAAKLWTGGKLGAAACHCNPGDCRAGCNICGASCGVDCCG